MAVSEGGESAGMLGQNVRSIPSNSAKTELSNPHQSGSLEKIAESSRSVIVGFMNRKGRGAYYSCSVYIMKHHIRSLPWRKTAHTSSCGLTVKESMSAVHPCDDHPVTGLRVSSIIGISSSSKIPPITTIRVQDRSIRGTGSVRRLLVRLSVAAFNLRAEETNTMSGFRGYLKPTAELFVSKSQ